MMKVLRKIICIYMLLAFVNAAFAQKIEMRGIVTDGQTGEVLPNAIIKVQNPPINTFADNKGFYSIKFDKPGVYQVSASYLGYKEETFRIDLKENRTFDFKMENNVVLGEVVISSKMPDERVKSVSMGVEKLTAAEIKKMPALMGEVDVLKAIQLLPGVQTVAEGGSGYSVRGGSPDQNLILLDNTTVYNASHLLGFFSVFNNDVLSGVDLYKGDFPMKYGGRLSSLLDVRTKEDHPDKFSGVGGIGLIFSRLTLEGPIGENTSWLVAGRRSYADIFLKLSSDEALRGSSVYFYDLNGKLTHRLSKSDAIDLNAYYGKDNFGMQLGSFVYGNGAGSLTWRHVFNDALLSRVSFNLTDYRYGLESKVEGSKASWNSSISDYMLRADMTHYIGDLWNMSYGLTSMFHNFRPGHAVMIGMVDYKVEGLHVFEHSLYASNEQKFSDAFSIKYGTRLSIFQNIGPATVYHFDVEGKVTDSTNYKSGVYNSYTSFEPRLGFVLRTGETSSMKGNYVHNTQFMQLANNSASGSPLDVWFPASPNIKPQIVDMFSFGYFRNFQDNMYETSIELYYKKQRNVVDFAEHADLMLNKLLEGEVRIGHGEAYGSEFMVRKNKGRLTGFANYTLSHSERTIPQVNNGKTYLSPYDKTHSINVVANYELSKKISLSAIWVYSTGNPTTYPSGRFEIDGQLFPIYSGRNQYRKPDYHRLDLSFTYTPRKNKKRRWQEEWNISFYNAYNKKNPWMINYDQDSETGLPYAEMVYLFGIVPSITYNFKF